MRLLVVLVVLALLCLSLGYLYMSLDVFHVAKIVLGRSRFIPNLLWIHGGVDIAFVGKANFVVQNKNP